MSCAEVFPTAAETACEVIEEIVEVCEADTKASAASFATPSTSAAPLGASSALAPILPFAFCLFHLALSITINFILLPLETGQTFGLAGFALE